MEGTIARWIVRGNLDQFRQQGYLRLFVAGQPGPDPICISQGSIPFHFVQNLHHDINAYGDIFLAGPFSGIV